MLLERAAGLATKIAEFQRLKGAADEAAIFQTRANQFTALAGKLSLALQSLRDFSEAGVRVPVFNSDARSYAAKAKQLREALVDNPSIINDPPFDLKYEFADRINAIALSAEKGLSASWSAYVAQRADRGSTEVLGALAAIPQFQESVRKIRQCRSAIESIGAIVPSDPKAAIKQINTFVTDLEKAWAELSADDIPASVITFIRTAASEGAMLASFTEEVRTWLNDKGLTSAFRIRLS
ncbi:hypothetical protein [Ensifer sp. R-19]|uniref:hypothetical protein n=1 Tax=Ensifer sp. R-19 TaxID=3404055 RepID=UPI003CF7501B